MKSNIKKIIILLIVAVIAIVSILIILDNKSEVKTIKSDKQLLKIYEGDMDEVKETAIRIITMPISLLSYSVNRTKYIENGLDYIDVKTSAVGTQENVNYNTELKGTSDYSTTNIQVENVDEADIIKTDGEYIYSISDTNVIITNAHNPEEIYIEATIESVDGSMPEDIILYNNKLIVISAKFNGTSYYSYGSNSNTVVSIYNIETKAYPVLEKEYELNEPYYTSRCINNMLYVISSGYLRKDEDEDKINRSYIEDSIERKIDFNKIKYLKDIKTRKQTLISSMNLDNIKENIDVSSYLIDISNAYVSENGIYLLDEKYNYSYNQSIKDIFGLKGIFGESYNYKSNYETEIYKFNILKNGKVEYYTKNKIDGKTINQYSLDEKDGHLRIALYDRYGSRIAIFNEELDQIGISEYVAKGETMYSSRFMGNKAYLVTYKTVDPLFVIDLSDESQPQILGQLKIPGYSTYLHPYDENHIIGIGMETEEVYNRNSSGKVISTSSKIIGMKMALFDVSNVNSPKEISKTVIGDRRTTSAILTNPKALLFSKEKNLLAIPVNNYAEDFEIDSSSDNYSSIISLYTNYNKQYISEGYFVYNINIEDGFDLKGVITHEAKTKNTSKYSYYYNNSKLLRGLYIGDNLYTVSETTIKVNKLDSLEPISELKITNK